MRKVMIEGQYRHIRYAEPIEDRALQLVDHSFRKNAVVEGGANAFERGIAKPEAR